MRKYIKGQHRCSALMLLFFLLLITAACSREGKESAARQTAASEELSAVTKNPDSCTLVSKAEIQQAVGQDVGDPRPNPGNAAMCDFQLGEFGSVSFMVMQRGPAETPGNMFAEFKKRNFHVTEAGGIGDSALFVSPGMGMTQLIVFKGRQLVTLILLIPGATEAMQRAAAEELMRKALARL